MNEWKARHLKKGRRVRRFGFSARSSYPQRALGRFVRSVFDEKSSLGAKDLTQKALLEKFNKINKGIDVSAPTFSKFLRGESTGSQNWYPIISSLITEILHFGGNASPNQRTSAPKRKQTNLLVYVSVMHRVGFNSGCLICTHVLHRLVEQMVLD